MSRHNSAIDHRLLCTVTYRDEFEEWKLYQICSYYSCCYICQKFLVISAFLNHYQTFQILAFILRMLWSTVKINTFTFASQKWWYHVLFFNASHFPLCKTWKTEQKEIYVPFSVFSIGENGIDWKFGLDWITAVIQNILKIYTENGLRGKWNGLAFLSRERCHLQRRSTCLFLRFEKQCRIS